MAFSSKKISVILLAGGKGTRMGLSIPKQYLKIAGRELALYSYDLFCQHPDVVEISVVCEPQYQPLFKPSKKTLHFARPGERRQDSTFNGLKSLQEPQSLVCVHDAARPCIELLQLNQLFDEAREHKAAVLGMPSTSTLKEVDPKGFMVRAIERSTTWTIQTPQVIERTLLERGFQEVHERSLEVTDESSIMDVIAHPVKVVRSTSRNIKVTEPSDIQIIEAYLSERRKDNA